MATWAWIVIIIAVVVVVAVVVAMITRWRRTAGLRNRFGAEYDRAVESADDRRAAETELREREKQRAVLDIRPLSAASRARYAAQWRMIQERFVDEPAYATSSADALVHKVMAERGYPTGNFSAQSDLVSVDYPALAENYRVAHAICERAGEGQASTEDLREGLLRYRSLFSELLGEADATAANGADPADAAAAIPDADVRSVPAQHGAGQASAGKEAGDESR